MIDLVDVSQFNGRIDYERVARSGIAGAYVRAIVGKDDRDAMLLEHANGFRSVGCPFGVYGDEFTRHARAQDACEQAKQLAEIHHEVGATLRPMIDVEDEGVHGLTGVELARATGDYVLELADVRNGSLQPMLYTGPAYWGSFAELRAEGPWFWFASLWLAAYVDELPPPPAPFSSVTMWQYQGGGNALPARFRGRCDGIEGDVDRTRIIDPRGIESIRA